MEETPVAGSIGWHDIAVDDAEGLRSFYEAVFGWTSEGLDMGGYEDYVMKDSAGNTVSGICHRRGPNINLPSQWLMYVHVPSFQAALDACLANGGKLVDGPREMGESKYGIIQDPAGAVCAIFGP
jgi:predicted enzyme related to lactoylglutathione lyase